MTTYVRRPVVLMEAPRCPDCRSIRYSADGGSRVVSDEHGERIEKYVACSRCGTKYKIILD